MAWTEEIFLLEEITQQSGRFKKKITMPLFHFKGRGTV